MVYNWKSGSRVKGDPQKVGEELEALPDKNASSVVRAAKKSKGELHNCFEWDTDKAAEEYWLEQARLILRSIVIVTEPEKKDEEPVVYRAYEPIRYRDEDDKLDKEMTYVPVRKMLTDPELRVQVANRLLSMIGEAEETAKNYMHLSTAFKRTWEKLREAREGL
jgi:hypothetical protein